MIDPADAPPGFAAVTELLGTARSAAGVPVPAAAVARRPGDLGLAKPASVKQASARWHGSRRRRVPVLAAVAFCAMTGGAYAAGATGAGSSTVSAVLDHIGVGSLVGASSGDHAAATSGTAALKGEAPAQTTTGAAAAAPVGAGHGESGKGDSTAGKGVQISTAASGGKSHAGEHGHSGSHPAHPTHPTHPVHPTHPTHPSHPTHPAHPPHPGGGGNGNGGGSKKPGS
ncbi:MAG: hypothetical protein ACRDQE_07745 [Gaiellales bacterium]